MLSIWVAFTENKSKIKDIPQYGYAEELQEIYAEYNDIDKTLKFKVNPHLNDGVNTLALIPQYKRVIQLYIEEWHFNEDYDVVSSGFKRLGYGTLKGHINGYITLIDVQQEDNMLQNLNKIPKSV